MTKLGFHLCRQVKVNVVQLASHFFQLLIGYVESQFLFCSGKSRPKLAPRCEFHGRGPDKGHFFGGISLHEGMLVDAVVEKGIVGEFRSRCEELVSVGAHL